MEAVTKLFHLLSVQLPLFTGDEHQLRDNRLGEIVTVTTSTANKRDHSRSRTAFSDAEAANEFPKRPNFGTARTERSPRCYQVEETSFTHHGSIVVFALRAH